MRKRILAVLVCLCLCAGTPGAIPARAAQAEGGYVVCLREGAVMPLSRNSGMEPVPYADGYYTVGSLAELQPYLNAGLVEAVSPNEQLQLLDETPTGDPGAAEQWYLETLGISHAWAAGYDGSGVKIAVIDSGLFSGHEDLVGARITGHNFLGADGGGETGDYSDDHGHGTLVSGILAARTGNGVGISGLTDAVELLALRCFSSQSGGVNAGSGALSTVLSAIGYAIEQEADVINMSIGGTGESLKAMEPLLQKAADAGILLVAAAGNLGGTALYYPAAFDCVTAVGSVDSSGAWAAASQHNKSVYVAAPGVDIYGLGHLESTLYRRDSGTSFAAPMVAALAAMAKQADPAIGTEGFRTLLRACAADAGEPGRDDYYGHGIVDAGSFAAALDRPYAITYELGENGTLGESGYATEYQIGQGGLARLPEIAERPGHWAFAGWYADAACTAGPLTAIAPGAVGDMTFYAKWEPTEVDLTVSGVSVREAEAHTDDGLTWSVALPWGTVLADLAASEIAVSFADSRAACTTGPERAEGDNSGANWTFTVGETSYSLRVSLSEPPPPPPPPPPAGPGPETGGGAVQPGQALVIPETGQSIPYTLEDGVVTLEPEELMLLQSGGTLTLDLRESGAEAAVLPDALHAGADGICLLLPEGGIQLRGDTLAALPAGEILFRCKAAAGGYDVALTVGGGALPALPAGLTLLLPGGEDRALIARQDSTRLLSAWRDGWLRVRLDCNGHIDLVRDDRENGFRDVAPTDWYFDAVTYAGRMELFSGVDADTFDPDGTMTRGMLAMVLWRMERSPAAQAGGVFSDVPEGAWYAPAAAWAEEEGLVTGDGAGRFLPDAPVSREQILTILWRFARAQGISLAGGEASLSGFADAARVSPYAAEAVAALAVHGVAQGSAGLLDPQASASRSQVAAMLERFIRTVLL